MSSCHLCGSHCLLMNPVLTTFFNWLIFFPYPKKRVSSHLSLSPSLPHQNDFPVRWEATQALDSSAALLWVQLPCFFVFINWEVLAWFPKLWPVLPGAFLEDWAHGRTQLSCCFCFQVTSQLPQIHIMRYCSVQQDEADGAIGAFWSQGYSTYIPA